MPAQLAELVSVDLQECAASLLEVGGGLDAILQKKLRALDANLPALVTSEEIGRIAAEADLRVRLTAAPCAKVGTEAVQVLKLLRNLVIVRAVDVRPLVGAAR